MDIPTLLGMVSDAVVMADGSLQVTYINPEAERLTGFGSGNAAGMDLWDVCRFVHRNTRKVLTDRLSESLDREGICHLPGATVLVTRDGDDVLVGGTVFILRHADDSPCGYGLVLRDMGAKWLLDPALRNSQKADAIKMLARGIAGNVNDLLTVLLARISGIGREQDDRDAVLRHVREARKIIGRISGMVAGLTADTVDRTGRDICSMPKMMRVCSAQFSSLYPDVRLELAYPEGTGLAGISCSLMEQVLLNLLTNAGRAAGTGGRVVLTACRSRLAADIPPMHRGACVMVSISDSGPGIAADELNRVFSPFFSAVRDSYGLGLPAVYSIVNSCGGYLTVDSSPGSGCIFTVYIPVPDGLESETGQDPVPVVEFAGIGGEERERTAALLSAIGCEILDHGDSGDMRADGPETGKGTCRIIVSDLGEYRSVRESRESSGPAADGYVIFTDEGRRATMEQEGKVAVVERPANPDKVASALTRLAWAKCITAGSAQGK